MERLFKVRYWDYSNQKLNMNGYICLSSSIAWGFFSILLVKLIHPPIARLVLSIPAAFAAPLALVLVAAFTVDTVRSVQAALDLRAMATDYATSPVTGKGQIVYGIGCGLFTVFIRYFGSYNEGVCYSIMTDQLSPQMFLLLSQTVTYATDVLDEAGRREIQTVGASQLLKIPEFRDADKAHQLMSYLSDEGADLPTPDENASMRAETAVHPATCS